MEPKVWHAAPPQSTTTPRGRKTLKVISDFVGRGPLFFLHPSFPKNPTYCCVLNSGRRFLLGLFMPDLKVDGKGHVRFVQEEGWTEYPLQWMAAADSKSTKIPKWPSYVRSASFYFSFSRRLTFECSAQSIPYVHGSLWRVTWCCPFG